MDREVRDLVEVLLEALHDATINVYTEDMAARHRHADMLAEVRATLQSIAREQGGIGWHVEYLRKRLAEVERTQV